MNEVLLRYTYQEMRYFMEEPSLTIGERTERYLSLIHVLNHLMPKEGGGQAHENLYDQVHDGKLVRSKGDGGK